MRCGQGSTPTIAPGVCGQRLQAVFSFGPTPDSQVPPGSFLMSGTLTDGVLQLNPQGWADQPPGYGMAALHANVSGANPGAISGQVRSPACTTCNVPRR